MAIFDPHGNHIPRAWYIYQKKEEKEKKKQKEEKEYKNTKESNEITIEENRRRKEQRKTTGQLESSEQNAINIPINNYVKCKWIKCSHQNT